MVAAKAHPDALPPSTFPKVFTYTGCLKSQFFKISVHFILYKHVRKWQVFLLPKCNTKHFFKWFRLDTLTLAFSTLTENVTIHCPVNNIMGTSNYFQFLCKHHKSTVDAVSYLAHSIYEQKGNSANSVMGIFFIDTSALTATSRSLWGQKYTWVSTLLAIRTNC